MYVLLDLLIDIPWREHSQPDDWSRTSCSWWQSQISSAERLYKVSTRGGKTQLPQTRPTMHKFLLVSRHLSHFSYVEWPLSSCLYADFWLFFLIHKQKLNFVLDCECCCCEQPISTQKFLFTAISLDIHNNNIHNLAQNSASDDGDQHKNYA